MDELTRVRAICEELNLPEGEWILNGSGVLALQGIERDRPMGDLDVFCSTAVWFSIQRDDHRIYEEPEPGPENRYESARPVNWRTYIPEGGDPTTRCDPPYLYAVMHGLEVNIFFQWRRRENEASSFDPALYIKAADYVDGIPCVSLGFIISWKLGMNRDKDIRDVLAIRQHLGRPKLRDV